MLLLFKVIMPNLEHKNPIINDFLVKVANWLQVQTYIDPHISITYI